MTNPFVYMELHPNNPGKAKSFYGDLLGWRFADMDMDGATYTMVSMGAEPRKGTWVIWMPCARRICSITTWGEVAMPAVP